MGRGTDSVVAEEIHITALWTAAEFTADTGRYPVNVLFLIDGEPFRSFASAMSVGEDKGRTNGDSPHGNSWDK